MIKSNSSIKRSRHASIDDITSTTEFFSVSTLSSVNVENDRIIVIVIKTLDAYFRNKKTFNTFNSVTFNVDSNSIDETKMFTKE